MSQVEDGKEEGSGVQEGSTFSYNSVIKRAD